MRRTITKSPTFAGLFCGCGGFDLGFEQAGFRGVGSFDIDERAVDTFNANLQSRSHRVDLLSECRVPIDSTPDVVIAGPPCQGFSTLGTRKLNDSRNSLLVHAAALAVKASPQVFVLENVSGAVSGSHRQHWTAAEQLLNAAGFHTHVIRIAASEFGLPQIRKRLILLAAKRPFKSRVDLRSSAPPVTLRELLNPGSNVSCHDPKRLLPTSKDLAIAKRIGPHQKLSNVRRGPRAIPTWDIPEVFGEVTPGEREILELIQLLRRRLRIRETGDADPVLMSDLEANLDRTPRRRVQSLQAKGYLRQVGDRYDLSHTFNGKFRRLAWDQPTPTVDTRFGQPRYFLHPDEHRGISVREAARIQGFPDSFEFPGSKTDQYRMIGNAVSPRISRCIATYVLEQLL